jgi:hypothetical protein
VPLHAVRTISSRYDQAIVADDQVRIGMHVAFEDAQAAVSAHGAADALPGGFVQEDEVGAVRTRTGAVIEKEAFEQAGRCPALVLLLAVLRPIGNHLD